MQESFLQYIWRYQIMEGELRTTEGNTIHVVSVGELNRDSGPDFFNAHLMIGDTEWVGNVEIHVCASDWEQHGHGNDDAYNNVVLHVVYNNDREVFTHDGRLMPTLVLRDHIPSHVQSNYDRLMGLNDDVIISCAPFLSQISSFHINAYLDRLLIERLEEKTQQVRRFLDECHGGWEQCCYWLMAHYFGGKANALPFELLARSTDMRILARWKDNPERLEALLMGQAGLLDECFNDDYPRQLQNDYEALRKGLRLQPISGSLWKFFRIRPSGFPTLRISQFARLISRWSGLFSQLLETTDVTKLLSFFDVEAAPYWQTHYRFDQPSKSCTKSVGTSLAVSLVINAWVPLLFEYGKAHDDAALCERAIDLLHQLPSEQNSIVTLWHNLAIESRDAAASQALLQLHNNYCKKRRCLQCNIGYQAMKL